MRDCIRNCMECSAVCREAIMHSLAMGGRHAELDHIRLLADCADICIASANFMLRGSPRHVRTCAACAEVCRECARECDQMAEGDSLIARCAEACHHCEDSCLREAAALA